MNTDFIILTEEECTNIDGGSIAQDLIKTAISETMDFVWHIPSPITYTVLDIVFPSTGTMLVKNENSRLLSSTNRPGLLK